MSRSTSDMLWRMLCLVHTLFRYVFNVNNIRPGISDANQQMILKKLEDYFNVDDGSDVDLLDENGSIAKANPTSKGVFVSLPFFLASCVAFFRYVWSTMWI